MSLLSFGIRNYTVPGPIIPTYCSLVQVTEDGSLSVLKCTSALVCIRTRLQPHSVLFCKICFIFYVFYVFSRFPELFKNISASVDLQIMKI